MLRECIATAEDCENYLKINKLSKQFDKFSYSNLVLKHHMKLPHFSDPLPISLLKLFVQDNNIFDLKSNDFELIWADTEFCCVNNEWIWQKNLVLEFYWKEVHLKLEFCLNLELSKKERWLLFKSYDHLQATKLFGNQLRNIQIVGKDYKQLDQRPAVALSTLIHWSNIDFYLAQELVNDLLEVASNYENSPDSYIDVTTINDKGELSYQEYNFPYDVSMSEIMNYYKTEETDVSNRRLQIEEIVEGLSTAYNHDIFILLDLKKIVKSRN